MKDNIDWNEYYNEYMYWAEYAEYIHLINQEKHESQQDKV